MRRVLITGGTGSIGSRLVKDMLNDGHFVYFTTRTVSSGQELLEAMSCNNSLCKPVIVDFLQTDALESILNQINSFPDFIIHNARSLDTLKINSNGIVSNNNFQKEFFNGVTFPYSLTMALLKKSLDLKDVLFISSMYGNVAPSPSLYDNFEMQSPINYGVVKAAQIHMTKELAVRLASMRVRVNSISYGGVIGLSLIHI